MSQALSGKLKHPLHGKSTEETVCTHALDECRPGALASSTCSFWLCNKLCLNTGLMFSHKYTYTHMNR